MPNTHCVNAPWCGAALRMPAPACNRSPSIRTNVCGRRFALGQGIASYVSGLVMAATVLVVPATAGAFNATQLERKLAKSGLPAEVRRHTAGLLQRWQQAVVQEYLINRQGQPRGEHGRRTDTIGQRSITIYSEGRVAAEGTEFSGPVGKKHLGAPCNRDWVAISPAREKTEVTIFQSGARRWIPVWSVEHRVSQHAGSQATFHRVEVKQSGVVAGKGYETKAATFEIKRDPTTGTTTFVDKESRSGASLDKPLQSLLDGLTGELYRAAIDHDSPQGAAALTLIEGGGNGNTAGEVHDQSGLSTERMPAAEGVGR